MGRKDERSRTLAATVSPSHGAWLVMACGTEAHDRTTDEIVAAAASLKVAKRLAREMAKGLGFEGAVRWSKADHGSWYLEMTEVTEVWDGVEDDD